MSLMKGEDIAKLKEEVVDGTRWRTGKGYGPVVR